MPLCKLGTVKRQAGGSNVPTVHGKWVAEPGSTMERCCVWHPSPGTSTEQGAQHILGLWMALVARSLRKCLEQLQRGNAGGRRGKPAGKPRTESTRTLSWEKGRQGMHQNPETWCPHQKSSTGSTKGKHWAHMDSSSIQNEKPPFTQRRVALLGDHTHKKNPVITSLRNSLAPLIVLHPRPHFPCSTAPQLQRG